MPLLASVSATGSSCSAYTDTPWSPFTQMKLDTDYELTSKNSCTHHIAFDFSSCGVQLLVEGVEATTADASSGYNGVPDEKTFDLRLIRKRSKAGAAGISPSGLSGNVGAPAGSPGSASSPRIDWSAGLGGNSEGYDAGSLLFTADLSSVAAITESLFSVVGKPEDILIVNDPSTGLLRQIVVPDAVDGATLVDFIKAGSGMDVRFYNGLVVTAPSSGLWSIPAGNQPAVTYVFTIVVSGPQRTVSVVERRPNAQGTVVDSSSASSKWNGTSLESTAGGSVDPLRRTTVTTSVPLTAAPGGSRTETTVVLDSQQNELQRVERVITRFDWGEETTEERAGVRVTKYSYFTNPEDFGYGKPAWIIRPGGDWTKFEYARQGAVSGTYSPWKSAPASPADATSNNCVYETTSYHGVMSRDVSGRTKFILGRVVSDISYASPFMATDAASSKSVMVHTQSAEGMPTTRSAVFLNSNPEPWKGRTAWTEDGLGARTQYIYESGGYNETTGVFTPGSGLYLSETTELVNGADGQPVNNVSTKTVRISKNQSLITETSSVRAGGAYIPVRRMRHQYDPAGRRTHIWVASATAGGSFASERIYQQTDYLPSGGTLRDTDAHGIVTEYQYDSQRRIFRRIKPAKAGEPASYQEMEYDAEGRAVAEWEVAGVAPAANVPTPASASRLLKKTTYDVYGAVSSETDTSGLVTTWQPSAFPAAGGREESFVPASGIQQTSRYFRDGQVSESFHAAGTADDPSPESRYYDYIIATDGSIIRSEALGAPDSPAATRTVTRGDGRVIREERPAFGGGIVARRMGYDSYGRNVAMDDDWMARKVIEFDKSLLGRQVRRGFDVNKNGTLDTASTEPITEFETRIEQSGGNWWRVSETFQYNGDNSNGRISLGKTREQLTGLSATQESISVSVTADGRALRTTASINRANATVTRLVEDITNPSIPVAVSSTLSVNGNAKSETLFPGGGTAQEITTTTYDGLGRVVSVAHPVKGTRNYAYKTRTAANGGGTVIVETPQVDYEESGLPGDRNRIYYTYVPSGQPGAGQVAWKYLAKAASPTAILESWRFAYNRLGSVRYQWGSSAYPVSFDYSAAGQLVKMRTYRSFPDAAVWPAAPGTADQTLWEFDPATRLLTAKQDAAGNRVVHTYTPDGKPLMRQWARGVTTTYRHDSFGRLRNISYSDGTPPVIYTYDRMQRPQTISDASGLRTLTTHNGGGISTVSYSGGLFDGVTVSTPLLPTGFTTGLEKGVAVSQGGTGIYGSDFGYDALGRFSSVTYAGKIATYGYWPQSSSLIGSITFSEAGGGGTSLVLTSTYDGLGRLKTRNSRVGSGADSTTLQYPDFDHMSRRKTVVRSEPSLGGPSHVSSNWDYAYNARGEVQAGTKREGPAGGAGIPIPGATFNYLFDSIGNRSSAIQKTAGQSDDVTTAGTAGPTNAYTAVTNPAQLWITGEAAAGPVSLIVDGGTPISAAVSTGSKLFGQRVPAGNAAPQRLNLQASQGGATAKGSLFVPPMNVTPSYDNDGNLLSDGLWNYAWDGENRLKSIETAAGITVPNERIRHTYVYDSNSRRVQDTRHRYLAGPISAYVAESSLQWIYEGWNCLLERQGNGVPVKAFAWGLDLTGSRAVAGGVGALLFVQTLLNIGIEAPSLNIAAQDGNGNTTQLFDATNKNIITARYDYSPFGETILMAGARAYLNPFRFSTKYTDLDTGLLFYGYRYYDASKGRWLSRDPISENGGLNLYGMAGNDPLNHQDYLGLDFHHWFCQEGDKDAYGVAPGQYLIWTKFEELCGFNIDDYTTWMDGMNVDWNWSGTPHQYLHGKPAPYGTVYESVFMLSQNGCQFLTSMKFLMEACHILLTLKQKYGGFPKGSYNTTGLQLVKYLNSHVNNNLKYQKQMLEACGGIEHNPPIPAIAKFYLDIKEFERQVERCAVPYDTPAPAYTGQGYDPDEFSKLMKSIGLLTAAAVVIADDVTVAGVANDIPLLTKIAKQFADLYKRAPPIGPFPRIPVTP